MLKIASGSRALIALAALMMITSPAATQNTGQVKALAGLQRGLWELRELGTPTPSAPHSICVSDPALLLQLQHRDAACSRLVLENEPRSATVHYTCAAGGFGRTTLRVSSPSSVRIETQGIDRDRPFDYVTEAHRKRSCSRAERG